MNAYYVILTILAGTVSTDLSAYPVMVRLSGMPAGFWDHVKSDGGDIRVKTTGGVQLPQDLVRFDYVSEDGVLFFKADVLSGSDNSWDIYFGDSSLEKLVVDDANGRNAVWSDYECVMTFGESGGDDRTGSTMAKIVADPQCFEIIETSSTDLDCHQGVCWDGTYYYTVDDNKIVKWNSSWVAQATNSDPIGDTSIADVNHLGDPEYHDGKLYIPLEEYPNSPYDNQHIVIFDPSDLSFDSSFDISAQGHEVSSIAYCDEDGWLYITDYTDGTKIYKYDPADGSYEGYLTLDQKIYHAQGITWWRDFFWVNSDLADETMRVSYDGGVSLGNVDPDTGGSDLNGIGGLFGTNTAGNYEGIGRRDEDLLVLVDPGTTERVDIYRPIDMDLGVGGGVDISSDSQEVRANGLSSYTTFTIGVTASIDSKGQNRVPVSYWDESAGGTNTRATIAYRNSTEIGWGLWDGTGNSWLMSSPLVDPTIDQAYRLHAVYDGTTSRKLYIDGSLSNTDSGITSAPSTLDTLLIGEEDEDHNEDWDGLVGFAYLYPGVLSSDWISAEYDNLNDPTTFYDVSAVQEVSQVATPVLVPVSGEYPSGTTISITCSTPDSTIYYTLDGSIPDNTDIEYVSAIPLSVDITIKAIAIADDYIDSEIATETYSVIESHLTGWLSAKGLGPWDFIEQPSKWGYLNQPNWTDAKSRQVNYAQSASAEPQVWTPYDAATHDKCLGTSHNVCGHWHKAPVDYVAPVVVTANIYGLCAFGASIYGAYFDGSNISMIGRYESTVEDINGLVIKDNQLVTVYGNGSSATLRQIALTPDGSEYLPLNAEVTPFNNYDATNTSVCRLFLDNYSEDRLYYFDIASLGVGGRVLKFDSGYNKDLRGFIGTVTIGTDGNLYMADYVYADWLANRRPITGEFWTTYYSVIPDNINDGITTVWDSGNVYPCSGDYVTNQMISSDGYLYAIIGDSPFCWIRQYNKSTLQLLASRETNTNDGYSQVVRFFTEAGRLYILSGYFSPGTLYSYNVSTGSISPSSFVNLTSGKPADVICHTDGYVYVLNNSYASTNGALYKINPSSMTIIGTLPWGDSDNWQRIISLAGNYLAIGGNNDVGVINVDTMTIVDQTEINPWGTASFFTTRDMTAQIL